MGIRNILFQKIILSSYILSFLRNWNIQPFSATITCSVVVSLTPNDLLIPKGYKFYNKTHIKCCFVKLQTHLFQDQLFIGCDIYPQVMVIWLDLLEHVQLGLNTLGAPPVCILGAKLWKVVMKCKIAIFLAFVFFSRKLHI